MSTVALRLALIIVLISIYAFARAQSQEEAMLLVAHPAFRDLEYRQTVILAAPAPNGSGAGNA